MEQDDQTQHQDQGDGRVNGTDQETHDHAANQAQRTGVPGEVAEGRPEDATEVKN